MSKLSLACVFAAVLTLSLHFYLQDVPTEAISLDDIHLSINPGNPIRGKVNQPRPMTLTIKNNAPKPIRVVGYQDSCQIALCIETRETLVFELQPGEQKEIQFDLKLRRAEPFQIVYGLFLDVGTLKTKSVTLEGEIDP